MPLHRRLVRHHALTVESGVFVVSVDGGGPGGRAGLRDGDIIVGFDGVAVAGMDDLHRLLTEDRAGRSAEMTIIRGVDKKTLTAEPALRR